MPRLEPMLAGLAKHGNPTPSATRRATAAGSSCHSARVTAMKGTTGRPARSTERAEASDTSCSADWPPKMRASRILRSGAGCSGTRRRGRELHVRVRRDDPVLTGVGSRSGHPLLVVLGAFLLAQRGQLG